MAKTNKELAVELAGRYLETVAVKPGAKQMTNEALKMLLRDCYDAVHQLPNN